MYSRKQFAIIVLVLSLTAGGCTTDGASDAPQGQGPPGPVDPTAAPTSGTTTTPTSKTTTRTRKSSALVEWIKEFTPTGGGGGYEEAAYIWFMKGDCETTLSIARNRDGELGTMDEALRTLYEGAAAACLAAFHQRRDMWSVALARHGKVDTSGMSCWHRSVYRIFTALVEAYRDDPEVRFSRTGGSGRSECPQLSGLSPDHGSRSGGYQVEVEGSNLPRSMNLIFVTGEDITVSASTTGGRLSFTMPRYEGSVTSVTLKIADAPRIEGVYATFVFDGRPR
ncbi:IPT/TIG domain-containing protein [Virgisporangium aurantiacum]|uniref:IPT/TIG domain-containing protein n=1 Tax=Virgisporangium aurantiacum TaxID=175570 RepID=A0A8J4DYC2_9ACTN|nr:IPT/TIG domain-containing protein [Virgisporangium aurantiacum]GIJ55510.1 hypothetical protein Vau01_030260 [Virgisporangium aurantiacum]